QCKEPKRARNSQWYVDKALLLNAQEKGEVLDVEAEAFLADVECTAPYEGHPSSSNNISINEVQTNDADDIFGVVSYPLSQELHQEEGIESDNESLHEENTILYSEHMASNDKHPSGSYL
nr:hypothetical protein [Tanacetum cinerariifolium]